ncbi:MAG: hypothetical protein AVDCRST_MAG33-1307 [uncultured Thermomicrobiales bacterium]|uniref:Uncharacterized protein n=1 Tax=uncultured Thermomicrobiales bacterium TaxID=1645740 RepID=A0A6J4UNX9_9BACT|nr:MAG: hypothetical protein AVDCRST_MAG33-1307 [uncultured Thermomicrobiales bacterium]
MMTLPSGTGRLSRTSRYDVDRLMPSVEQIVPMSLVPSA